MAKARTVFICTECGYETGRWLGRCPECNKYNTFEENMIEAKAGTAIASAISGASARNARTPVNLSKVSTLDDIQTMDESRIHTGLSELDRVLSGGIVEGSLVLVGGDPGIGKSTLLLQICENIGSAGKKILYVSGEESVRQIKLRADRLGIQTKNLYLMAETDMDTILQTVKDISPQLVIIDSIQTMSRDEIGSAPGSVTQVRECTSALMKLAKGFHVPIFIVGHVTKEGALAGPRILEHMVDTVLYFEGERRESYRVIRAVKNRFGSTNEIGVFEMRAEGLAEITNPSAYMLSGRPLNVPGSAVTCSMEGTRPILAEVQALVSYTNFGTPRRVATGMDYNRAVMLIAVLEKRAGMQLSSYDSYLNIAGGMKIAEPALDAAAVAAVASSFRNKAVSPNMLVFGEVGLTGELRAVTAAEKRVGEAAKLGFTECVLPQANLKNFHNAKDIKIYGAANIAELLELCICG